MEAESYLHWLRRTDLASADLADLRQAVEVIMLALQQELEEEQTSHALDMYAVLEPILEELRAGSVPVAALNEFRIEFDNDPETYEPPEQVLEEELRGIAVGIGREHWCTENYERLERAVNAFLEGGEEAAFWDTIDSLSTGIESAHAQYSSTHILPKEVTLESQVVHKLLCEGIEIWKAALDSLRDGEEPDWDWLMQTAEEGNRLLIAVQIFEERVRSALS